MTDASGNLSPTHTGAWRGYAAAFAIVIGATLIGWPLYHYWKLNNTNILMLYLLGVLWTAMRYTRGAAVVASVFSVLAFDLMFVPPYFRLNVENEQYLFTFAVMLVTALVISQLTHRVRVQSEETRTAWERAEAEFLRNTLLSGVSHELRTPLAAITGAASTLLETSDGLSAESRREMLDMVLSESERMERLVTNLLDMTRLESGGLRLRKEWVPLAEVIGSALHHIDRRLHGRQIDINVPDDLPMVQIDSVGIERVLVNLLDNAIEYTPADSPIDISAHVADGKLSVSVADHGPGLPEGTENRVFEKFFRAHVSESRRGIGLGLAICRSIVEAHGGKISAGSNPGGGGALFRFTLPLTAPPAVNGLA
jgi:K+-sensing histidine kinase KdpD